MSSTCAAAAGRSLLSFLALALIVLLADPAAAGGRKRVIDGTVTNTVNLVSRGELEVLPTGRILAGQSDAINATGKNAKIVIRRGAIVKGNDGVQVDHARYLYINGAVRAEDDGVEVDGFGDYITRIIIGGSGSVKALDDGIELDNGARAHLTNHGLIEGKVDDGVDDFRGWLINYGSIRGGDEGVDVSHEAMIWNYNLIQGGRGGDTTGDGIDLQTDRREHVTIWNGPYGVIESRSMRGAGIEISPDAGPSELYNWGLVQGGKVGIRYGLETGSNSRGAASFFADNHGIIRGLNGPAISVYQGGTLRVRGTGSFVGGVAVSDADGRSLTGGRLILDGVNVPYSQLGQRVVHTDGGSHWVSPRLSARGFDEVVYQDVYSFQEYVEWGLMDAADAVDWAVIPRLGVDLEFIGIAGESRDDPRAVNRAFETFTGRSVAHGMSDIAFTSDTFLSNKIQDQIDRDRDRTYWEDKRGVERKTPWGAFAFVTGTSADQAETDGRVEQDWNNYGGFIGGTYEFNPRARAGGLFGYRRTEADVDYFGSGYNGDDYSFGFFGDYGCGCGFQFSAASYYTRRDYEGNRSLMLERDGVGLLSNAVFDTNGNQLTTYVRSAWHWRPEILDGRLTLGPRFAVQHSALWIDGYDEKGAGVLNLQVEDQTAHSLRTALGFRVGGQWEVGKLGWVRPELRYDWYHETLDDGRNVRTNVESPYIREFNVDSDVDDRDFHKVGFGITTTFARCECVELNLGFDTIVGREGLDAYEGSANVGLRF